jgi:hypothetical protein
MYNLDGDGGYIEDCPKCKHSMERLAAYNSIKRNEGYSIDDGSGNSNILTYVLFGWVGVVIRLFTREVLVPIMTKLAGERKQTRYEAILNVFPKSLICPHCKHIIRQK